jgi:hypothetical protein
MHGLLDRLMLSVGLLFMWGCGVGIVVIAGLEFRRGQTFKGLRKSEHPVRFWARMVFTATVVVAWFYFCGLWTKTMF